MIHNGWDILGIWGPSIYVVTVWVKALLLALGVKNPKVGNSITPRTSCPLPVAVVYTRVVIHEFGSKIPFAPSPVYMQVLHEERRGDHAAAIVHVACSLKLTHASIHHGIACLSLAP